MELFDIVDENDNLLGFTKPREQVHRELVDWHRITGVWIVNVEDKVLCQQRSFSKDVYPGMWMLTFGGHLKAGESYEENVLSELREELGLSPRVEELEMLGSHKNSEHKHHGQLYVYRWNGQVRELRFNDGEVEQVKWVSLEEYHEMQNAGIDTYPVNPLLVEYLLSIQA